MPTRGILQSRQVMPTPPQDHPPPQYCGTIIFFFNCVFTKVELGERSQWLVMSLACCSKIHTKGSHFSKLTNFYPTTESLSLVAHVNFSQVRRGTWNKSYK